MFEANSNVLNTKLYSFCKIVNTCLVWIVFFTDLIDSICLITAAKLLLILVNVKGVKMQLRQPI